MMNSTGVSSDLKISTEGVGEELEINASEEEVIEQEELRMRAEVPALGNTNLCKSQPVEGASNVARWSSLIEELRIINNETQMQPFDATKTARQLIHLVRKIPYHSIYFHEDVCFLTSVENAADGGQIHWKLTKLITKLLCYSYDARDAHKDILHRLISLSGRSQSDAADSSGLSGSKRKQSSTTPCDDEDMFIKDRQHLPQFIEPEVETFENLVSFVEGGKTIGLLSELEKGHQSLLKKFSSNFQQYFDNATIVSKNNENMFGEFKASFLGLETALLRNCICLNERHDTSQEKSIQGYFPGPNASEIKVTQPFLMTVLQSLATVLEYEFAGADLFSESDKEGSLQYRSPLKSQIQTNRIIPKTTNRPKRIVDKTFAVNGRFLFMIRDDMIEIPIEEKPGEREGMPPIALSNECTNQILSSLSKIVGVAFNFKGIGVDTKAIGVVLTPVYVKVIQIRLVDVGKGRNVSLHLLQTGCLPLLPKPLFEKWITYSKMTQKWRDMKLYEDKETVEQDVPMGLVALWNLITSSRADLLGRPSFDKGESKVGEMIGFGAFVTVHRVKDQKRSNEVIKLSRYGAVEALENEFIVLQNLQKSAENNWRGISQLVEWKKVVVTISDLSIEMPALSIKPFGLSAQAHVALNSENAVDVLHHIAKQISDALDFIHSQGYYHNDVTPKNILVEKGSNNVFLIDFGLATKGSEDIKGFRGTVLFVHRSVFGRYPKKVWKAESKYDFSGLAFSIAVLSNQGKSLWKPFEPRLAGKYVEEFTSWADERSEKSWRFLQKNSFDEAIWKARCYDT